MCTKGKDSRHKNGKRWSNKFIDKRKKRFELKVMAVLLNAFGLSLRKTSSFFGLLSEPVSKSCVEEWMRKVLGGEAELRPQAT